MKKHKRTSKSSQDLLKIVVYSLLFWLIVFSIIVIYTLWKNPINFGIFLNKQQFEKGEELHLQYKMSNWWFDEMKNVSVTTQVMNKDNSRNVTFYVDLGFLKNANGEYSLNTSLLTQGNYTIESRLSYNKKFLKETKPLTLSFKVD